MSQPGTTNPYSPTTERHLHQLWALGYQKAVTRRIGQPGVTLATGTEAEKTAFASGRTSGEASLLSRISWLID